MTMGSNEGFKEYAQKWRDLAGRVQPPLFERELMDMFMGTLTEPFFNHLIGSSSSGFTELILNGEHVESGLKIFSKYFQTHAHKAFQNKSELAIKIL